MYQRVVEFTATATTGEANWCDFETFDDR